jgi:amino acid transporter
MTTPDLHRGLGPLAAASLVAGAVIGTGIFVSPSLVAARVGAPGLALLVWVVCGLLALCGGLCYAELSAAMPETGGTYVYLRRAFRSELLAFLFGWSMFFVVLTGVQAAVATAFAIYAGYFLEPVIEYGPWAQRAVAVACIGLLALMNIIGVAVGGGVQMAFTAVKVAALGALVVLGLTLGPGGGDPLTALPVGRSPASALAAIGTAMIVALFAYNGWWYSSFVAGEVTRAEQNVPRSIFFGMAAVLTLYGLANVAYLRVLPFESLAQSERPAADLMGALIGPAGATAIAVAVMLSAFGTVNAQMLAAPRIYFAMARDGHFFGWMGRVHRRFRTPAWAIGAQAAWAAALALSGTFRQIVTYTAFPNYLFLSLAVAGLIVLRRREPDLPRPYRVALYPITPVLFLAVFSWYLINSVVYQFRDTMIGIGLALSGVPFYYLMRIGSRREDRP